MKYIKLFELWTQNDTVDYQELRGTVLSNIVVDKIATHFGEEVEDYLGGRANGYAFKLKSGKVLKITKDKKEAKAINRLRKKRKFKHIVSYYDLRKFNDIYVTIMDYVKPLDEEMKPFYNKLSHDFLEGNLSKDELKDKYADIVKGNSKYIELFNIMLEQRDSILKEFKMNKLEIYEADADNVGFGKSGNFKFFDIHLERKFSNKSKLDNLNKEIK